MYYFYLKKKKNAIINTDVYTDFRTGALIYWA